MDNIGKIAEALCAAQADMQGAKKESRNPHFKNTYADLESVVSAVRGPLTKNGIAFIQPFGRDELGDFCDTIFIHKSGETLQSRIYLSVDRNNMQGLGSAQTYARRYGLMGLAGIAPADDDGNAAAQAPPAAKPALTKAAALKFIWDAKTKQALDKMGAKLAAEYPVIAADEKVIEAIIKMDGTFKTPEPLKDDADFLEGK